MIRSRAQGYVRLTSHIREESLLENRVKVLGTPVFQFCFDPVGNIDDMLACSLAQADHRADCEKDKENFVQNDRQLSHGDKTMDPGG